MVSTHSTTFDDRPLAQRDEPKEYKITTSPMPGERFIVRHRGKWYAQDEHDLFYGPYENPIDAANDDSSGRPLSDLDF